MNITQEQDTKEEKQTKAQRMETLLSMTSIYLQGQKSKTTVTKKILEAINKELKQ